MKATLRPGAGDTRLDDAPEPKVWQPTESMVRKTSERHACIRAHATGLRERVEGLWGPAEARSALRTSAVSALAFLLCLGMFGATGCGARLISDGLPDGEGSGREEVVVERVTDGDTVEVRPAPGGVDDVRLIGVDAPEAFGPSGPQPYAAEAAGFAERVLEGRRATLEFDVERTDRYGRLLAYVYGPDGGMFNEALLLGGYAQVATFPPNTRYEDWFEAAQGRAREAGRGI